MTYFAYLDEFGHIGPYVSREDPRHNDSPVFGLAGFVLPSDSTERSFARPSSGLTNSAKVTAGRRRISS